MKVTVDSNVLVRMFAEDDPAQTALALALLERAGTIVIPLAALCETVWVLRRLYKLPALDIADQVERLLLVDAVSTDRQALAAGVTFLRDGSDFADGAIAEAGRRDGGDVFVSFDREAVARWRRLGHAAAEPIDLLPRN